MPDNAPNVPDSDVHGRQDAPLAGVTAVQLGDGVALSYAGRLLATFGATVILVEPPGGSSLRTEPPFLGATEEVSAVFSYVSTGKRSVVCDLATEAGGRDLARLLEDADVLLEDLALADRDRLGLSADVVQRRYPRLVHVSVLPFGATGPKAHWVGTELNLMHASGEGYLLPNGLSVELFPDRPPLKIHGHFAEYEGGVVAALAAMSALYCRAEAGGQFVDVSVQDAMVALSAFAVQRLGDGSLEHRTTRSFRYGGVLACADGFVQLLTLENRQWQGLVTLMGSPQWAADPALRDPMERGRRGDEVNRWIREWAKTRLVEPLVAEAQRLGVPMCKYNSPADVLDSPQAKARGLFQPVAVPGYGTCAVLTSPFNLSGAPLVLQGGPPECGVDQDLLAGRHRGGRE